MIAEVKIMNKFLEQALLYDFYGELLTEHQKDVYEQVVLEDYSLSEIAQMKGISRQGVHDLVKRCQKILEGYEAKLHLVEKFLSVKEKISLIDKTLAEWEEDGKDPEEIVKKVRRIAFDSLSEKLQNVFKNLRSKGRLTEADVKAALREVKMALLEADVNFKVVKGFIKDVQERAIGQDVMNGLNPGQMVIKIVNEELIRLMGSETTEIKLQPGSAITVIMMAGLQGAGKTTTTAKLAGKFKYVGTNKTVYKKDEAAYNKELATIRGYYEKALPHMERVRALVPAKPNEWAHTLQMIYSNLGMKDKLAEVEEIIKGL